MGEVVEGREGEKGEGEEGRKEMEEERRERGEKERRRGGRGRESSILCVCCYRPSTLDARSVYFGCLLYPKLEAVTGWEQVTQTS